LGAFEGVMAMVFTVQQNRVQYHAKIAAYSGTIILKPFPCTLRIWMPSSGLR
jgi:hypothetical protein